MRRYGRRSRIISASWTLSRGSYTRSSNAKIISYVNKAMAETCMDFANERKLKIGNAGLRMFEKAREKASQRVATKSGVVACPCRLNHESLHLVNRT